MLFRIRMLLPVLLLVGCFSAVYAQETLHTAARGTLQAVCEGPDGIRWAVTDEGEILHSADGIAWTVLDFNAQYAGFYPQMDFRAVAAGGGSVMVAGVDTQGHLAVYTSSRGSVWSPRSLDYTVEGERQVLDVTPCSLSYDFLRDSFFLCGTGGTLFEMPGCSHCNRLTHYPTDTLYVRIRAGFNVMLLGSGGFRKVE